MTGQVSGLVVLDVDARQGRPATVAEAEAHSLARNGVHCRPPWVDGEVVRVVRSIAHMHERHDVP